MRKLSLLLVIVLSAFPVAAFAASSCTSTPTTISFPALPQVYAGGGMQAYYCAATPYPTNVGDLTPLEWAKHVQVCTTNCSYEPMSPTDPRSMLVATGCGPGDHNVAFMVDPPRQIAGSTHLVDSCTSRYVPKGNQATPPPRSQPRR